MGETTIYFVETGSREQRELLCRWVEHLYDRGKRIQVVVDSTMAANQMDQQLWTFSETSFIPHRVLGAKTPQPVLEPVLITIGQAPAQQLDGVEVLICDAAVAPEYMAHFQIVVHFIFVDDDDRRAESRSLWQKARDLGYRVQHVPRRASSPERNL